MRFIVLTVIFYIIIRLVRKFIEYKRYPREPNIEEADFEILDDDDEPKKS